MRAVTLRKPPLHRKGVVLVLAAVLMVFVFAFVAFTVDVGYMTLTKGELQNAADSAALAGVMSLGDGEAEARAVAIGFAGLHRAAGSPVLVPNEDVLIGRFDFVDKTFTETSTGANAVRVFTRVIDKPFFFAPVIGHNKFDSSARATAMLNPRDIVFVVDTSGSMNDDTEPLWATRTINGLYAGSGYPNVATPLIQGLYTDLGFGTYPGTVQHIGQPLGVPHNDYAFAEMTKDDGALADPSIPAQYRILVADSEQTRRIKGYSWIIDNQIAVLMPAAQPTPNSTTNYGYWEKYIDYVIDEVKVPCNRDRDDYKDFDNPNKFTFSNPDWIDWTDMNQAENKIGYKTYVQFLLDFGRDRSPDVDTWSGNAQPGVGTKTQLSIQSPHCAYHDEVTAGGTFSFPPREQPMHACRRSLIAALKIVKDRNAGLSAGAGDRVAIISFDGLDSDHAPILAQSLTSSYTTAMASCTTLQAVSDIGATTAIEAGLIAARAHLKPTSQGGQGRSFAKKVVVLLTDGVPNAWQSSTGTINGYIDTHPHADYYDSGYLWLNSALMQASKFEGENTVVYPVGIGLGTDYNFMDRMARMANTDKAGLSPRGSGNPAEYEQRLTDIFTEIIKNPGGRMVD